MLVWFAAVSVVLVAVVFRSGGVDYRYVVLGSILPVAEAITGGPKVLHSVLGAVVVLAVAMAATQRRRLLRRKVLGIPIGLMAHLLLDGSFTDTTIFWWPVGGWAFGSGQIPEIAHPLRSLVLEAAGLAVAVWAYRLFGLDDEARRQRLISTGRLDLPEER